MPDLHKWEEELYFDERDDTEEVIAALHAHGAHDEDDWGTFVLTGRNADLDGTAVSVNVDKADNDRIYCFAQGRATFGKDGIAPDDQSFVFYTSMFGTLFDADEDAIYASRAFPFTVEYALDDTGAPDYPKTAEAIVEKTWETLAPFIEWVDDTNKTLDSVHRDEDDVDMDTNAIYDRYN